jgi:hypothetical protein
MYSKTRYPTFDLLRSDVTIRGEKQDQAQAQTSLVNLDTPKLTPRAVPGTFIKDPKNPMRLRVQPW